MLKTFWKCSKLLMLMLMMMMIIQTLFSFFEFRN